MNDAAQIKTISETNNVSAPSAAICHVIFVSGLIAGLPSLWETLAFSWDPTFQAPALKLGATHTNYHAFREFTLTIGAITVMAWAIFQPTARRSRELWWTMLLAAVFYYGGWWLPYPLLGLHTPNTSAEIVHIAAALLTLTGIVLARRHFGRDTAP